MEKIIEPRYNSRKKARVDLDLTNSLHTYLFGYLWADGNISKDNYVISSSSSEEITMLKLKETFGGTVKYRKRVQVETGADKNCYEWFSSRINFVNQFKEAGFRKTIDNIPIENIHHFILGFLDGDGCIYHNKNMFQLTFTSKLNEDWTWFENAVSKISTIKFSITKRHSWCKSLNKRTYSSIARLTSIKALQFLELLYNNSDHGLDRKKIKYKSYLKLRQLNKEKK